MRLRDWQSRFAALVASRKSLPLQWGVQDCCMFAADVVEAVTGEDPARHLRGAYTDERGAVRIIRELGGVERIAATRLGPEVSVAFARPADIGLTLQAGREALAVCGGQNWHAPGLAGIVTLEASQILKAWRVG